MSNPFAIAKEGGSAVKHAADNAFNRFAKCVQDGFFQNNPDSCDISETVKDIEIDSADHFREILKRVLTDAGIESGAAESWAAEHARELWDKAEKVRNKAPAIDHSLNYLKWLFRVAAVAGVALATGLVHPRPGQPLIPSAPNSVIADPVPSTGDPAPEPALTVRTLDEAQAILAASPPPPAAALPPPVAAMAAQPLAVVVEDTKTGETRTIDTTVGTAYSYIPATRSAIRNEARHEEEVTEAAADNTPPPPEHHFLDADPNNTLHSGEENPAWKFPNKLTTGQIDSKGSFDGDGKDLHER